MKSTKTRFILLLSLTVGSLLAGCTSRTGRDTSIPWTRPANWEGQIPGLSQPGN